MSSLNSGKVGNGNIDSYPPVEDLRIRKILIIRREIFEELKKGTEDFKIWLISLKKKETENKLKVSLSGLSGQSRESDKPRSNNKQPRHQSIYLPTNIGYTCYGNLWKWRRVNKWVREFIQENENMDEKTKLKEIAELCQNIK